MKRKKFSLLMILQKRQINSFIKKSIKFIHKEIAIHPKIAIILGSGLGDFAESITKIKAIDSNKIPNYPHSTVEGHKGKLLFCELHEIPLLIFQGRVHYYETGNLESILYPIRVASELGVKILLVTNAAGSVSRKYLPGDLMLIDDQINLTFENPLLNLNKIVRNRPLYDDKLKYAIKKVAVKNNIPLKKGIYCGIKGPSYETAAEIEMIRRIGANVVGMSTVNEVSLAVELGMRVVGISCITNLSTGITKQKLSHEEVTYVANKVKNKFTKLINSFVESLNII